MNTFMKKGKVPDPDPYLRLMDPDPAGHKTCGSGSGSGSLTLGIAKYGRSYGWLPRNPTPPLRTRKTTLTSRSEHFKYRYSRILIPSKGDKGGKTVCCPLLLPFISLRWSWFQVFLCCFKIVLKNFKLLSTPTHCIQNQPPYIIFFSTACVGSGEPCNKVVVFFIFVAAAGPGEWGTGVDSFFICHHPYLTPGLKKALDPGSGTATLLTKDLLSIWCV